MRIKKVKSTKNEYVYSGGVWVRNLTKLDSKPLLENNLFLNSEYTLIMNNERSNHTLNLENISEVNLKLNKVLIVSDGLFFKERHQCIKELGEDVAIIVVNKALKKWEVKEKNVNFFVVNNPYEEVNFDMPSKYFPVCLASTRSNFKFLNNYPGVKYLYEPTPEKGFGYSKNQKYFVDDYRNPISAAVFFAYKFGASKIMLFSCDNSFVQEKPGSVLLNNGYYTYPQHLRSQDIIDAQLFWLSRINIKVADYSFGKEYNNAAYIRNDDEFKQFFLEDQDEKFL